jgi:hypothetical protein
LGALEKNDDLNHEKRGIKMNRRNSFVLIIICLSLLISMASGLIVDIGPDQAVRFGDTVPFRVSVSDYAGGTLFYTWDFGDGTTIFGSSTTPDFLTIHRYTHKGIYTADLSVTSEHGSSATDTATITVANVESSIVGWGRNDDDQATPPAGNDYVAIAAGVFHSLALKSDGSIKGWGYNYHGQATPPDGNDYVAIAAGDYHSLALKSDGSIKGWGYDISGQATPPEGNNYVAIAAGRDHSLALKSDGSIKGWGYNFFGQATPPDGNDYVAIAAGGDHNLALKSDGSIKGSGRNDYGQATPPEGNNYVAIRGGEYHSLALKSDGSIKGWGYNFFGQATPPEGNNYVAIAARGGHSLALKSDGSIKGWGYNYHGQATPPDGNDYVAIAAGRDHNLALTLDETPPTTTLTTSGTHGTNDWYTSNVLVTLSAIDNVGGSGLPKTEYNLDNPAWTTYTLPFTISDEGTTTVNYRSTDNAGNVEDTKTFTVKIDKTQPEVTISTPTDGATYIQNEMILADWSVSDSVSGIASQSGTVTSGSAIDTTTVGTTTFSVTATDYASNQNTISVTYTIESPAEATEDFIDDIKELNLPQGTENSLTSKLENAIDALNRGNTDAAIIKLEAFISEVRAQQCKKIPCDKADELIAMAQRIIDSIGG